VQPFVGVIDGESAAIAGPYAYSFDTNQTGSVTAAAGSARIDRLDVQVSDPAESDGSSVPTIAIIYTAGTAGAGVPAAAPARTHKLCLINVPASGGGSPTVSWAPDWSGDPGEWTFNTLTERDAYVTAIGSANVPVNQRATVIADSTAKNNDDYIWAGTAWIALGVVSVTYPLTYQTIYSAGSPAPTLTVRNGRAWLDGQIISSSATFGAGGAGFTAATFSTVIAPTTTRIFGVTANGILAFVNITTTGQIVFTVSAGFTGALSMNLGAISWTVS
jgi:hypothetical protein